MSVRERNEDQPSLIFIMGRGHSGTTVLDCLLGNAHGSFGMGEYLSGCLQLDRACSCGETTRDCPVWSSIIRRFNEISDDGWEQAGRRARSQARFFQAPRTMLATTKQDLFRRLTRDTDCVIRSVTGTQGGNFVIDSTKESTRGLFLARFVSNAVIVHLVRHPEAVVSSYAKRIDAGDGFHFFRHNYKCRPLKPFFLALAALSWTVGNLLSEIVKLYSRGRCVQVRYEDLVADPESPLRQISRVSGIELEDVIERVRNHEEIEIGCTMGGNRLRMDRTFVFEVGSKPVPSLPAFYRWTTRLITFPLMIKYGYIGGRRR